MLRRAFLSALTVAVVVITPLEALARGGGGRGSSRGASKGGSHPVRSHTTRDGRYVPPHRATNPDGTKLNNWSTRGNVNPYTGKPGTKNP
jgi:hypothetical protein